MTMTQIVTVPELLAPAGNLEKLKTAVHFGADAVYIGGKSFGLRNQADNFTIEEMVEGVAFAHRRGVKVYLTVNSFPYSREFDDLALFLEETAAVPLDAVIVADPGVLSLVRELLPERPVHLSTQANTLNWRAVEFWRRQGVGRVNLARELSLEDIRAIRRHTEAELEVFVHGAMCISYSGRCLMSGIMTGRHANRGECTHPCRWSYALVEEKRPGEYYPVEEAEGKSFIFNARDLCLLPHLPDLIASGVNSLKIEGRMKGISYVGTVVRVYRQALDAYAADPERFSVRDEWLEELGKISHRGYTTGFLLGQPGGEDREYHSRYIRDYTFVGVVEEILPEGEGIVAVRNRLRCGDRLELLGPRAEVADIIPGSFRTLEGEPVEVAHPNSRIVMKLPPKAAVNDLLRKLNEN